MSVILYNAQQEFYQNGTIHTNFFYSIDETAPLHTHDFFEIFLVTNGSAQHYINDKIDIISANTLVFIRPHDVHRYLPLDGSVFQMVNLSFISEIFNDLLNFFQKADCLKTFLTDEMPFSIKLNDYQRKWFAQQILHFCYQKNTDRVLLQLAVRKLIIELFYNYYITAQDKFPLALTAYVPEWFDEFYILMDSKEYFVRSPRDILSHIKKNPQYVMRIFKKITGQNLTDHLMQKKMDYAHTLLLRTQKPITEIAFECGYENLSTFYHSFSRFFNRTPKSFRK